VTERPSRRMRYARVSVPSAALRRRLSPMKAISCTARSKCMRALDQRPSADATTASSMTGASELGSRYASVRPSREKTAPLLPNGPTACTMRLATSRTATGCKKRQPVAARRPHGVRNFLAFRRELAHGTATGVDDDERRLETVLVVVAAAQHGRDAPSIGCDGDVCKRCDAAQVGEVERARCGAGKRKRKGREQREREQRPTHHFIHRSNQPAQRLSTLSRPTGSVGKWPLRGNATKLTAFPRSCSAR